MSKITPKKLTLEDFPDQQGWMGKLIQPLNEFFNQIYQGWNNGLSIDDNLHQELRDVKVSVDANTFPMKVKAKFNTYPKAITVVGCQDSSGGPPSTAPWVTWSFSAGQISINSVSGLTVGKTYSIRFHIIYS